MIKEQVCHSLTIINIEANPFPHVKIQAKVKDQVAKQVIYHGFLVEDQYFNFRDIQLQLQFPDELRVQGELPHHECVCTVVLKRDSVAQHKQQLAGVKRGLNDTYAMPLEISKRVLMLTINLAVMLDDTTLTSSHTSYSSPYTLLPRSTGNLVPTSLRIWLPCSPLMVSLVGLNKFCVHV